VTLILLPAVDVADGQAVRLVQGAAGSETSYGDPVLAALAWQSAGAQWLHLVDLDAAFGRGTNADLLAQVTGKLDIKVEMSGGIRDDDSLERALATGCARVNVGTAALEKPDWVAEIKEVTVEQRDEDGRPALVSFRVAAFGRSTSYTLAYDYAQAPKVLAWRLTKGDITTRLDGAYQFEAAGEGLTEVTYHLEVEMKVPLPGFIKMRAQSRIMSIALRDLKARVESES